MISKLKALLLEPFPQSDENRVILRNAILAGLIVAFILVIFRPFGFAEVATSLALTYSLIFGSITALTALGLEMTMKYILKLKRDHPDWTLWKWMLSMLAFFVVIAIANYCFTVYAYGLPHSFQHFLGVLWSVLTIGIFPVSIFGLLTVIRYAQRNEKIAKTIDIKPIINTKSEEDEFVYLPAQKSENAFKIDANTIICVEAMQNYVQVYFIEEGVIQKKILRNTLSNMEKALQSTSIQRSHRSFLLNIHKVQNISGNAQGLKIELDPSPGFWVPVSRKYIPSFKAIA